MKTNDEYSKTEPSFINACKQAGIPATTRQASKFKRGMGLAYKVLIKKVSILKDPTTKKFIRILNINT